MAEEILAGQLPERNCKRKRAPLRWNYVAGGHQTSDVRPRTSDLRPRTSDLGRQTSDLRPRA
ncbi:hypothetical protein SBA1_140118 [Candidatus Sulfotelmatobacter kueseliae]|uniref:Uncharacterized protein n=1 Tax=Candidatus Sulfotelmatobacter kueseliae TaxID=2042962 RepID=A0A2U3K6P2_9BACT|nr:hypothetical protein SBA1_140118 [Candidatus Sulfotelmatobacter kueseliae]